MYVVNEIKEALEALGWVYQKYEAACGGGTDDTYLAEVWIDPSGVEHNVPPAGMNHRPGWCPTNPELIGLLLVDYKTLTANPYWDNVIMHLLQIWVEHDTDETSKLIRDLAAAVKWARRLK